MKYRILKCKNEVKVQIKEGFFWKDLKERHYGYSGGYWTTMKFINAVDAVEYVRRRWGTSAERVGRGWEVVGDF